MSIGWMNTLSYASDPIIKNTKVYRYYGRNSLQEIEGELELKQYLINLATYQMICMARIDYEVAMFENERVPYLPISLTDDEDEYRFDNEGWDFIKTQCEQIMYSSSREKEYEHWLKRYEQVHNIKQRPYTSWISAYSLGGAFKDVEKLEIL